MLRVGFEPMTPVFVRTKTVHALDRAATVIDKLNYSIQYLGFPWLTSNGEVKVKERSKVVPVIN
jgi:hypothetical protein